MASPEVIDLEKLFAPIPGDNPAGTSIRNDFSPSSVYFKAKDARNAARNAEKALLFEEEGASGSRPDWRSVVSVCTQILSTQAKDLEIASWLVEAVVREEGFAGLRDGFKLMRGLCEQYWDNLYPMPDDEDGMLARVAPLAGLNGEEGPGALITPINNIPITEPGELRALNSADYRQAVDLERVDPEKRERRLEQGAISLKMFERTVMQTSPSFFTSMLDDLSAAIDEYAQLCKFLDEHCGTDQDGMSASPPSSYIRSALSETKETIESVSRDRVGSAAPAMAEVEDGPQQMSVVSAGNVARFAVNGDHVQTREAAFRELLRVAEYFKRTEPHSPVSYALEQAVRWGQMPLPALLNELITDESTKAGLFRLVGITSPPSS